MQPCLCHPKRHRLLAREAELGAVPPHAVEHHADAPGLGEGPIRVLHLRQNQAGLSHRGLAKSGGEGTSGMVPHEKRDAEILLVSG